MNDASWTAGRRPAREPSLKELIAIWRALFPALSHPYEMGLGDKDQLAKASPHFGGGSVGKPLAVKAPFLYALTNVRKVDYLARWRSTEKDEVIRDQLMHAAGTPRRWISLAPLVSGPLKSFRNFTWWTTCDIVSFGQPFIAGRRLGLLDAWIADSR